VAKTIAGRRPLVSGTGWSNTPLNPTCAPSPKNVPPLSLKTKLYPIKNHWKETIASETIDKKINDKAFLRLVKPE
jgi:hypothetical protein